MAALAGTTLVWPGTAMDRMWSLNPTAYQQLAPFGTLAGVLFLALSAALAVAGVGWFMRRKWGWGLGVAIIAFQIAGDLFNAFRGEFLKGVFGAVVAGALLFYLLRPAVRAGFENGASGSSN